jgi:hypothetical protein
LLPLNITVPEVWDSIMQTAAPILSTKWRVYFAVQPEAWLAFVSIIQMAAAIIGRLGLALLSVCCEIMLMSSFWKYARCQA